MKEDTKLQVSNVKSVTPYLRKKLVASSKITGRCRLSSCVHPEHLNQLSKISNKKKEVKFHERKEGDNLFEVERVKRTIGNGGNEVRILVARAVELKR